MTVILVSQHLEGKAVTTVAKTSRVAQRRPYVFVAVKYGWLTKQGFNATSALINKRMLYYGRRRPPRRYYPVANFIAITACSDRCRETRPNNETPWCFVAVADTTTEDTRGENP